MKAIIFFALLAVVLSLHFDHERVATYPKERQACMVAANKAIGNKNGVLSYGGSDFTKGCKDLRLLSMCVFVGACVNAQGSYVSARIDLNPNADVRKACCSYK